MFSSKFKALIFKILSYPLLKNLKFTISNGFINIDVLLLISLSSEIKICFPESKLNILHIGKTLNITEIIFSPKFGLFFIFIYDNFFLIIISNGFFSCISNILMLLLFVICINSWIFISLDEKLVHLNLTFSSL